MLGLRLASANISGHGFLNLVKGYHLVPSGTLIQCKPIPVEDEKSVRFSNWEIILCYRNIRRHCSSYICCPAVLSPNLQLKKACASYQSWRVSGKPNLHYTFSNNVIVPLNLQKQKHSNEHFQLYFPMSSTTQQDLMSDNMYVDVHVFVSTYILIIMKL